MTTGNVHHTGQIGGLIYLTYACYVKHFQDGDIWHAAPKNTKGVKRLNQDIQAGEHTQFIGLLKAMEYLYKKDKVLHSSVLLLQPRKTAVYGTEILRKRVIATQQPEGGSNG